MVVKLECTTKRYDESRHLSVVQSTNVFIFRVGIFTSEAWNNFGLT